MSHFTTIRTEVRNLLTRSADEYRNERGALGNLTDGLQRLRESAVRLARSDAHDIIVSRFG